VARGAGNPAAQNPGCYQRDQPAFPPISLRTSDAWRASSAQELAWDSVVWRMDLWLHECYGLLAAVAATHSCSAAYSSPARFASARTGNVLALAT